MSSHGLSSISCANRRTTLQTMERAATSGQLMDRSTWTWGLVCARSYFVGRLSTTPIGGKPSSKMRPSFAGIGVVSTGHSHPTVVKAIQDQAAKIIHPQQNIFPAHPPMVRPHPCALRSFCTSRLPSDLVLRLSVAHVTREV